MVSPAIFQIENNMFQINNSNSILSDISCGVPQGSILGPILFIIYVNDLNSVSQQLRNIMFADDSNLFLTGNSIETIESLMNRELCNLIEWFQANLLSLNISKTNYIVFSKKETLLLIFLLVILP